MAQQDSKQSSKAGASAPAQSSGLDLGEVKRPSASEAITLTGDALYGLLVDAQRAGVSEDDLANLKRYLTSENLTLDAVNEARRKIAELAAERDRRCKPYWLTPGSRIIAGGTLYQPGDKIRLLPDEAAGYGAALTAKPPPKPQPKVENRPAGRYRVKGPGSVKHARQFHAPGAVIVLDADQAQDLGDAVEYIHPEPAE